MPIKFIIISLLLFVTEFGFAQEPPEMLNIKFTDAIGKTIYPELTIIETFINPIRSQKNSKDWDDLKIEEDTLVIKDLKSHTGRWLRIDSTGYYLEPNSGHYLAEEIKIIAIHNKKEMVITFMGQGMGVFGCWASDLNPKSIVDLSFEEGNFLYAKIHASEKVKLNDSIKISNNNSILYKGKISKDFKMITELLEINSINTFCGLSNKREFMPINKLLDYNTVHYGEPTYIGFLYEKNIPVGYCLINDGVTKAILFNSEYQKLIKKYYLQQDI